MKHMSEKNQKKVEMAKSFLEKQNIFFTELNNGQLQVDGVNFWATTEKWYDPKTSERGKGMNTFIKYLRSKKII